jgi:hypothetical protein
LVVAVLVSFFGLFFVKFRFLRWFGDEGLQAYVAWGVAPADVLSAFARCRCKQWVILAAFKALCGDGVCMCSFPLLPFQYIFPAPVDDELWKEEDD